MDLIPVAGGDRLPMVGGGPANTAKAVARLGYPTFFVGGISSDDYGKVIERELTDSGVDLTSVFRGELSTALAIATIDSSGLAKYDFKLEGTTSFAFDESWLPAGEPDVIHVGSVATLLEPGASELLKWVSGKAVPVVFDPNVRPSIQGDKDLYRAAIERWIQIATIVKLSEDDLNWLYGDESVVSAWLKSAPELVIVTRGERGISTYGDGFMMEVPAEKVEVVDTVGAGDTIGAIVVEGIVNFGVEALKGEVLRGVLEKATRAAGITCSRAGANPPWREELERV